MSFLWDSLYEVAALSEASSTASALSEAGNAALKQSALSAGPFDPKHGAGLDTTLQARIDRLVLLCQAMWTLLTENTDLTEDDLARRVTEIDLQDGQLDGKIRKPIVKCPQCDGAISHKYGRCLSCGHEAEAPDPFGRV